MITRSLQNLIRQRLEDYPATALVGPRQCGKTTLTNHVLGVPFLPDPIEPADQRHRAHPSGQRHI